MVQVLDLKSLVQVIGEARIYLCEENLEEGIRVCHFSIGLKWYSALGQLFASACTLITLMKKKRKIKSYLARQVWGMFFLTKYKSKDK